MLQIARISLIRVIRDIREIRVVFGLLLCNANWLFVLHLKDKEQ